MTPSNRNTENLVDISCLKTIPTDWKKIGEVFCKSEQPIFVCCFCLQSASSISNAYTTNDGSVFWWHIQNFHYSTEFETMEKISDEIDHFDTESVDSEITYGQITSREAEIENFGGDISIQNTVNLDEFHNRIVNNNMEISQSENDAEKECSQGLGKYSEEEHDKEDIKPNAMAAFKNFSNLNYYYDENETYTISDDEDDDEDEEIENTKFAIINIEGNITNTLKHNDFIEISDDEFSEDNIETRPNSPTTVDKASDLSNERYNLEAHLHSSFNAPEDNSENQSNFPYGIPTPETSPTESVNFAQLNYNLTLYNTNFPQKPNQHRSKKTAVSFRAFQCELCGTRTLNEENMKSHLERSHLSLLHNIEKHKGYHRYYHQLYKPDQNKPTQVQSQKPLKRPFKCKSCKRRTITIESMERHQQLYHGPEANSLGKQCKICHKRILLKKFEDHTKAHFSTGYNCRFCGVVYKSKQYMQRHIKANHENMACQATSSFDRISHLQAAPDVWTNFSRIINNT